MIKDIPQNNPSERLGGGENGSKRFKIGDCKEKNKNESFSTDEFVVIQWCTGLF